MTSSEVRAGSRRHAELVERLLAGEQRALSRAISLVEDEGEGFEGVLHAVHDRLGSARRIGMTGPPGAGKSTLTAAVARAWLAEGHRVGIVAVDPTSPFTGGALLGDRVRMTELATEPGVFIRSMASRGSVGGLATSTREVADLMDAAGYDRVVLETVGVGQSELDVAGSADTTVVVLVPESGDGIQAMKAGLMEVADLFVINKADRSGADRLQRELHVMMSLRRGRTLRGVPRHHGGSGEDAPVEAAEAPVIQTVATRGEGLDELTGAIDEHFRELEASGALAARRRAAQLEKARAALMRRLRRRGLRVWREGYAEAEARIGEGEATPYQVAAELARRALEG